MMVLRHLEYLTSMSFPQGGHFVTRSKATSSEGIPPGESRLSTQIEVQDSSLRSVYDS